MGKAKKEHRKKVAARNQRIKDGRRSFEKARSEYIQYLEKSKKETSDPNVIIPGINGPSVMPGPQI